MQTCTSTGLQRQERPDGSYAPSAAPSKQRFLSLRLTVLLYRPMSQNEHQRSHVGQGLQRLGHADDALNVGGVDTSLGAVSDLSETILAIHRVGNRAFVMTAC